ncbi:hypothetical protein HZ326_30691 [Fusarium oxysporum f. sp. albedinis]|nr:hypothetical protein HZ326_30691 [Fusarium oxysporum f. sp. albedinis]
MDDFRVEVTWRYLHHQSNFDLQERVLRAWAKVASPRLLLKNCAPFNNTRPGWKGSRILPRLRLRRLACSPLNEAQYRGERVA